MMLNHFTDWCLRAAMWLSVVMILCTSMSTADAEEEGSDPSSSTEVEVRLLSEITFDSDIQLMKVKDGYPRLVVTEKTINWLDADGNVTARRTNPKRSLKELYQEKPDGVDFIRQAVAFASNDGEWVAIVEYDIGAKTWYAEKAILTLLDGETREVARFPIDPLGRVTISNDGGLIAVYGPVAVYPDRAPDSHFALYDVSGNLLIRLPPDDESRWGSAVNIAFAPDCGYVLVQPEYVRGERTSVYLIDNKGELIWRNELDEGSSFGCPRRSVAFSIEGDRLIATGQSSGQAGWFSCCYQFGITGETLKKHVLPDEAIHELLPDRELSRLIVRYRNTIRCTDMESFTEMWRWTAPWPPRRGGWLSTQWVANGKYVVVIGRSTAGIERLYVLDVNGRLAYDKAFEMDASPGSLERIASGFKPDASFVFADAHRVFLCALQGAEQ